MFKKTIGAKRLIPILNHEKSPWIQVQNAKYGMLKPWIKPLGLLDNVKKWQRKFVGNEIQPNFHLTLGFVITPFRLADLY